MLIISNTEIDIYNNISPGFFDLFSISKYFSVLRINSATFIIEICKT